MSKLDKALLKAYEQYGPMPASNACDASTTARNEPAPEFRPMLQVDAFAWPEELTSLTSQTEGELDAVAAALFGPNQRHRTIGLAGSTHQAGCSTLLLGAAKRLAARGASVVLVDADENEAALAPTLGLLPSLGWEDIAAGREPLAEVLIESIEDRLALLPLRDPSQAAQLQNTATASENMQSALATLRETYDLVLVDLGSPCHWDPSVLDEMIDAAIVIHHVDRATMDNLRTVQDHLVVRQLTCAGVIENFVPHAACESYRRAA